MNAVEVYRWLSVGLGHSLSELVMAMKNVWDYASKMQSGDNWVGMSSWSELHDVPLSFYFYHPKYSLYDPTGLKSHMYVHINFTDKSCMIHVKEDDIPSITRYLKKMPCFVEQLDIK